MQTTAIGTVANSLPKQVILLTLDFKGVYPFAELQNIYDIRYICCFYILGFLLQSLMLYVQMYEAPAVTPPGYSLISLFNNRRYNCYTSVIFRYGRNFSRPTVYCFFNVGNAPVSSYCQPDSFRAVFICATASNQSPSVTLVFSMVVLPPSL